MTSFFVIYLIRSYRHRVVVADYVKFVVYVCLVLLSGL